MAASHAYFRRAAAKLAAAGLCAVSLSGCMTDKKSADAAGAENGPAIATEAAPPSQGIRTGLTAKGSLTTNTRYVDPLVATSARHPAQAKQQPGMAAPTAGGQQLQTPPPAAAASAFPPAPEQPAQSLSGLATQPTGVRAGSFSIFSSTAPAPAAMAPAPPPTAGHAAAPTASGAPPQDTIGTVNSGRNFSATNGSVFTPRQPLAPTTCPTDKSGRPVNC